VKYKQFQFQYGSIKRKQRPANELLIITFQFQYGSIKSFVDNLNVDADTYFNSNMVRLKAVFVCDCLSACFDFNSNMVRLKVVGASASEGKYDDFNSNMVRLKVG